MSVVREQGEIVQDNNHNVLAPVYEDFAGNLAMKRGVGDSCL
jgi:hypothetical protein